MVHICSTGVQPVAVLLEIDRAGFECEKAPAFAITAAAELAGSHPEWARLGSAQRWDGMGWDGMGRADDVAHDDFCRCVQLARSWKKGREGTFSSSLRLTAGKMNQ